MKTEVLPLEKNGWVPKNPGLPVLIYRGAVQAEGKKAAETFEARFADHGWRPQWRGSVYDYDHYHSTTHEALGIYAGTATLRIGGPRGVTIDVIAGDALVLPVGTGHGSVQASDDFAVVGAYPEGCEWDLCTEAPDEEAGLRMASLPVPARDPVTGGAAFRRPRKHPDQGRTNRRRRHYQSPALKFPAFRPHLFSRPSQATPTKGTTRPFQAGCGAGAAAGSAGGSVAPFIVKWVAPSTSASSTRPVGF